METVHNLPAHSCESLQFHSSSGMWTNRDGQDVWTTVKNNNTGPLTRARVYEFLLPLIHKACVSSVQR